MLFICILSKKKVFTISNRRRSIQQPLHILGMMIWNIHRFFLYSIWFFFTQYVTSTEFPLRILLCSSLFLLSLSLVLKGSSGGDVEALDRSGNSAMEKTKSPHTEIMLQQVITIIVSEILFSFKQVKHIVH